ncbi:hypothetical protein QN277_010008 [Acacia crassicarpa]|uniref:Uncharacterized protein n=1 Tax=Acacia crassicarpa TaxID=499986 RepID=A0AAE1IQG6_9FABA|nr:hypothetical protein QN277_010008 [Acacia crassicarpa]
MGTLLKTPNNLEFLHRLHCYSEKLSNPSSRFQNQELRFFPKKTYMKWGSSCRRASISALLDLVPEVKKETLDFELTLYDSSKGVVVDLAVVGGGPTRLAVGNRFPSQAFRFALSTLTELVAKVTVLCFF